MAEMEFFPQRPESHPTIYAYEFVGVASHQGYIKVGYTERDVETRIKEQIHTAAVPYRILGQWSAMKNDGSCFTDHDVHAVLKAKGKQQLNAGEDRNEWFKCTLNDVKAAVVAVQTGAENYEDRTQTFAMRPEQEYAVDMTMKYFKSAYEEGSGRTPKFLWNAKMRFGKTFAAYQLAKKMDMKRVLILTFKPAVQTAWREDLLTHMDFEGWQFITRPTVPGGLTNDQQYRQADKYRPIVCFGSFQDFLGVNKETGGIKANNEWVHTTNWDLVLYTYSAKSKPVICKKDADELRKAAIYYRYNSQNSEIDYPELSSIIQQEKERINERWMKMIRQIGDSGITKTALLDLTSGRMTGPNATLYIDENLLDEISFVQEGSFVETGGNPALKVVGQVQTVVGAQRVIVEQERNRAINADEIIKSFISQESVNNPMEFVKQICYSSSGNLPVYYFLNLSGTDIDTALAYINDIPINSMAKDILKRRISQKEVKYVHLSNGPSKASKAKQTYAHSIQSHELIIPSDEKEIKYCLASICGIERLKIQENKEYILNILYEIYTNYFNHKPFSGIKAEFRNALCWVDEALYMLI